jgi:hypothetical protein
VPNYIIYNTETGNIKRSLSCEEADLVQNMEEGEGSLISQEDVAYKRVVNGVLVDIPAEERETLELSVALIDLRSTRRYLLKQSDWTQVPDAPVDSAAWAVYRQQLRDLPANTTDPRNVVWPEPPS